MSGTPGKRTLTEGLQAAPPAADHGVGPGAPIAEQPNPSATEIAARGTSGSGHALPFLDRIQASFGRHDVGAVHAHTDGPAAAAAGELGARAFATNNHVAFAGTADLHTAAHEAAHVVQQRAGVALKRGVGAAGDMYEQHADAVADLIVNGQSAEPLLDQLAGRGQSTGPATSIVQRQETRRGRAAHRGDGAAARDYIEQTKSLVLGSIAQRIATTGLIQPHARLHWAADKAAAAAIAHAFREYVEAAPGLALKRLMMLSSPAELIRIVDDARNQREDTAWLPEVGRAIAEAFDVPLVTSIQRMGMRLRVQLDGDSHGAMPRGSDLVASCPLDGLIANVLVMPGIVTRTTAKRGATTDTPGRPFADGAREVEYEWLGARDRELWNWIHVTSPKGATAEHVARTPLAGGEVTAGSEQAYRIASSPPYFGIPIETAKLVPDAWKYAPDHLKTPAKANDPGPRVADGSALATSAVADEASLAQARHTEKGDLEGEHALDRANIQLTFLKHKVAPWHVHLELGPAQAFLLRRSDELKRDPRAGQRWAPVLIAAERILHDAASEATTLLDDLERRGAKPADAGVLGPFLDVIRAYAHAAGVSHLAAEAPAALAEARRLRVVLPIALAEDRIRVARAAVAEQQGAQREAGRVEDRSGESVAAVPDLGTRAADLRLHAARGEPIDADAADELAVDADETALRAQIVTFQTQLATVERRADAVNLAVENAGGWTIQKTTAHLRGQARGWLAQLDRTRDLHRSYGSSNTLGSKRARSDGARRTIATVRGEMASVNQKTEIGEFLKYAYERIADKQLRDALSSMALQIGIMIATGEVAGAAVAAVRGIALAREVGMVGELVADVRRVGLEYHALEVVAQSYLMTKAQGAMGGPSGATAFADNLLGMTLTTTALKPFEGLFGDATALEREIQTWSGSAKAGAKLAVKAPMEVAVGIGAAGAAHAVTHGERPTAATADDAVTQGIALVATKFVHRHTSKMRERIEHALSGAERAKAEALLRQIEALSLRAQTASAHPTVEDARTLLAEHATALGQEARLYEHAPGKPGAAARAQNAADQAGLAGAFVEAPFRLAGLRAVVDGEVFEGTPKQIADALAAADQSGMRPGRARDPQTGVWRITSGGRTYEIHELGASPSQGAKRTTRIGPHDRVDHETASRGEPIEAAPLTREQRAELVRTKDLNPRRDGKRLAAKTSDDTLALGKRLASEAEGQAILSRLAAGDASALTDIGVKDLPDGYNPALREFALLETRDGYVIVTGGRRSVDIPHGTRLLGHTHPESLDIDGHERMLDLRHEAGPHEAEITFAEIARDQRTAGAHESGLIPSPADVDAAGDGGYQVLHTRYIHKGGGKIANPSSGANGPRVSVVISQVKTIVSNPAQQTTTYEATFTVRAGGETLWTGKVYAQRVEFGQGRFDQLWFDPPNSIKRHLETKTP